MKKHRSIIILVIAVSTLFACSKSKSDPTPAGAGKFIFNNTVYTGTASGVTFNGALEVTIETADGKNIVFYNIPTETAGAFTIFNAFQTGVLQSSTEVYGASNLTIGASTDGTASLNGTLTKTGARGFTFTGVFQADLVSSSTVQVSGSASY